MDSLRRGRPYFWVTWLTGLVSGEKSCQWAAWYRSHHEYAKRPDAEENRLLSWKADHAQMVQAEAQAYGGDLALISVEDQNSFTYRGKAANVGGKPDLLVVHPESDCGIIIDCKTGKERDSDVVQVATYMLLAPHDLPGLKGLSLSGEVVYKARRRPVSQADADRLRPQIIRQVLTCAADLPPARVPSAAECRYCDIAACPDRIEAVPLADEAPAEGAMF